MHLFFTMVGSEVIADIWSPQAIIENYPIDTNH